MLLVKQSFQPPPLFNMLAKLGFVYYCEKINENAYWTYFIRKKEA